MEAMRARVELVLMNEGVPVWPLMGLLLLFTLPPAPTPAPPPPAPTPASPPSPPSFLLVVRGCGLWSTQRGRNVMRPIFPPTQPPIIICIQICKYPNMRPIFAPTQPTQPPIIISILKINTNIDIEQQHF